MEKDKYDIAIEYFTKYPSRIYKAWNLPHRSKYGYLFSYMTPNGDEGYSDKDDMGYGCPAMVRSGRFIAFKPALTKRIRAMDGIPAVGKEITVEHLPAIARAQRLADKMLNRK